MKAYQVVCADCAIPMGKSLKDYEVKILCHACFAVFQNEAGEEE